MRDIPVFATDYGVASLILKEIPYRQTVYVHLRDVQPGKLEAMIDECVSFCRAAGAEKVFASGHAELSRYPLHTSIWLMQGKNMWRQAENLPELVPVQPEDVSVWRQIYNERMKNTDNAAYLSGADEKRILSGGAYFVRAEDQLLGIGWIEENRLLAIAAVKRGAGEQIAKALFSAIDAQVIQLETASTNQRAIRLYERLGMTKTEEISRWYRIFG